MLATLGGALALLLGLAVLLLPLLLPELSRSRDAVWGAVVLLLGLVLVTSAERLTGAPMLGVLCGGLLIGRLGVEVAQGRWRQLSADEQQRLGSTERWRKALEEAGSASGRLLELASQWAAGAGGWLQQRRQSRSTGKRWVRPENGAVAGSPATADPEPVTPEEPVVVTSFQEIDALIEASAEEPGQEEALEPRASGDGGAGAADAGDDDTPAAPTSRAG